MNIFLRGGLKPAHMVFCLALAGCAARVEYVPMSVSCPPVPPLPSVSAQELMPLSDDAYRRLVERELRLKEHIGQLRALCEEGT